MPKTKFDGCCSFSCWSSLFSKHEHPKCASLPHVESLETPHSNREGFGRKTDWTSRISRKGLSRTGQPRVMTTRHIRFLSPRLFLRNILDETSGLRATLFPSCLRLFCSAAPRETSMLCRSRHGPSWHATRCATIPQATAMHTENAARFNPRRFVGGLPDWFILHTDVD